MLTKLKYFKDRTTQEAHMDYCYIAAVKFPQGLLQRGGENH